MTFISGFEKDIFISYSHCDNDSPNGEQGWVDHFHEQLESRLVRRFGKISVSIWRDEMLSGNTYFDDRIQDRIRKSFLFLALLSPNYIQSEYCLKELELFCSMANESRFGLRVAGESRAFAILLRNIHYSEWPKQFSGTPGFPMHDQKESSKQLGEFLDWRERFYQKKLGDIVNAIEKVLKLSFAIGEGIGEENGGKKEEGESVSVFIADTSDTLQATRDKLVDYLNRERVQVLERIPPPYHSTEHETAVKKVIDGSCLTVHLLDSYPGRQIEGAHSLTYPCAQVETGLRSHTRQLIWVPKELEYKNIEDRAYAGYLESLERSERQKADFEFVRDEKVNLPQLVLQAVSQIKRQREIEGENGDTSILLDTHQLDQVFAFKLAVLLNEKGIKVLVNQEFMEPASGLRNIKEALRHVRDLVIVFGKVSPTWVYNRLLDTINLVNSQIINKEKITLQNLWICLLPSSKRSGEFDNLPKFFKINYIDNRHSHTPDESMLVPLFDACNAGGVF